MDWSAILGVALTLFLILDPVGNIAPFLVLLKDVDEERRRIVVVRENLIAFATLVVFLLFGPSILGFLAIEGASLHIAGGVVMFLIALRMIFPPRGGIFGDGESLQGEPLIVPLAIPLLAGPSSMAAVMLSAQTLGSKRAALIALVIAWLASAVILLLSPYLSRLLGRRGLLALERLMGMVLTLIAVQMVITGVETLLRPGVSQ